MAIIESLSVLAGGGVISSASQIKQRDNVVNIFIGLGGTGIDAIRCIKKQVNERLIPDNADAYDNPNSNVSVREYRHIKFLGVDTDEWTFRRDNPDILENTEKMDLSIHGFFGGVIPITSRPDLKWFNTKKPAITDVIASGRGAGSIRQAGRFLLYNKIDLFETEIIQLVEDAKRGILGNCKVVVHIFSGVSGGTGSGTFLDVCYAVRKALNGIVDKVIVGYFFMPDINLSKTGLDRLTRENIPINAYAALQELNYCMGLPNNGGSFKQITKDGTYLKWNCKPVDMCHIIGAKTENNALITKNAYEYAMHTVTEYVMDFLSDNYDVDFDIYHIASELPWRIQCSARLRKGGYIPCINSLGASCASIPYREINTYLVSGMFETYRKTHNENATQADADTVIDKAWNVSGKQTEAMVEKIYTSLLKFLSGSEDGIQGCNYYQDPNGANRPWDYLLDTVQTDGKNELEAYYIHAFSTHMGILAQNADKLISESINGMANRDSLIYKLEEQLDPIVKDINRGPQFARNILDYVQDSNVLNLIQGLKAENNEKRLIAEKQRSSTYEDYKECKRIFFNRKRRSLLDNNKKRFFEFEYSVVAYVQLLERIGGVYSTTPNAERMVGVYEHIAHVLDTLEEQIKVRISTYYAPLSVVLRDLTTTFEENYKALKDPTRETRVNGFDKPIVSLRDERIIQLLEEQINGIPAGSVFTNFMSSLIDAGYDVWTKEDSRLSKVVESSFFWTDGVLRNSAGMTVDAFLEKKYGLTGQNLEQKIIDEYVRDLMNASSPLLPVDSTKLDNQKIYMRKVFYPNTSSVISNALASRNSGIDAQWTPIASSISDRFLFVQIGDVFPMQAYAEIRKLEKLYYTSSFSDGSHLYEEDGIYEDMPYSDWRTLPSVSAPSVIDETAPEALRYKVDAVKELFEKATEYGVIKINVPFDINNEDKYSYIYDIPDDVQKEIDGLSGEIDRIINEVSISEKVAKLNALQKRVDELISSKHELLSSTDFRLKLIPYRTDIDEYDAILKLDFLYFSPVYQIKVRKIIEKIDANGNALRELSERIKQICEDIGND